MKLTAELQPDLGADSEYEVAPGLKRRHVSDRFMYLYGPAKRQVRMHAERERAEQVESGTWPGYAAAVQDHERPGTWIAVVLLNRGTNRYVRRESFARFESSEDAYRAAESWLAREIERMRRS